MDEFYQPKINEILLRLSCEP